MWWRGTVPVPYAASSRLCVPAVGVSSPPMCVGTAAATVQSGVWTLVGHHTPAYGRRERPPEASTLGEYPPA